MDREIVKKEDLKIEEIYLYNGNIFLEFKGYNDFTPSIHKKEEVGKKVENETWRWTLSLETTTQEEKNWYRACVKAGEIVSKTIKKKITDCKYVRYNDQILEIKDIDGDKYRMVWPKYFGGGGQVAKNGDEYDKRLEPATQEQWDLQEKLQRIITSEDFIKEPEFIVGKWYKNFTCTNTMAKFLKIDGSTWKGTEWIGISGHYQEKFGSSEYKDAVECPIEEIQQYLPEGHIDKIIKEAKPAINWKNASNDELKAEAKRRYPIGCDFAEPNKFSYEDKDGILTTENKKKKEKSFKIETLKDDNIVEL